MEFQQRLERAIERGRRQGNDRAEEEAQRAMTEKERQRLHSQTRLELVEHVEQCLRQLADRFPGFRFESIVDDRGWGAAIARDDLRLQRAQPRSSCFSRLEMLITPITSAQVLELVAKGTVCNREVFSRTHYQLLSELHPPVFTNLIDLWVLEYAERYAAA